MLAGRDQLLGPQTFGEPQHAVAALGQGLFPTQLAGEAGRIGP